MQRREEDDLILTNRSQRTEDRVPVAGDPDISGSTGEGGTGNVPGPKSQIVVRDTVDNHRRDSEIGNCEPRDRSLFSSRLLRRMLHLLDERRSLAFLECLFPEDAGGARAQENCADCGKDRP